MYAPSNNRKNTIPQIQWMATNAPNVINNIKAWPIQTNQLQLNKQPNQYIRDANAVMAIINATIIAPWPTASQKFISSASDKTAPQYIHLPFNHP